MPPFFLLLNEECGTVSEAAVDRRSDLAVCGPRFDERRSFERLWLDEGERIHADSVLSLVFDAHFTVYGGDSMTGLVSYSYPKR